MQRDEDGGVVISCDFCGTDWDEQIPMIEGHRGSVLCLDCLKQAHEKAQPQDPLFSCVMCLREGLPADVARWAHPEPLPTANRSAFICIDCINQAAGTFSKDPDVDWKRR
jgi:hypothetical protein